MESNEKKFNGNTLRGMLLVLVVFAGLPLNLKAGDNVRFNYVRVVDNKDSQFTNTADIDGDGQRDILAFNEGFISWYKYPGFEHHIIKKDHYNAGRPLAADVDRDGDMDLVVAKNSDWCVYWYENPSAQGGPVTGSWTEHRVGSTKKRTKAGDYIKDYGDLDADGDPDVVTNGRWFETPANARTGDYVEHQIDDKWHNQGGTWQRNATMIRVADIDDDGRLDVVISHSEKEDYPVSWYSAKDPKAEWTEHPIDPSYGWCQTLDIGDIDGDGDLDVLAGRFTRPQPPDVPEPHDIRIYYNPGGGSGRWAKQVVRKDGGIYFGHLADMDGDGDLDIAGPRTYWTGPIEIWLNGIRASK